MIRSLFAAAIIFLLGACSLQIPSEDTAVNPSSETTARSAELTIYAASSLSGAFEQIAENFEKRYPQTTVKLSYDGSAALATQLISGATAEVFASADRATMSTVIAAGLVEGSAKVFARNTVSIAVQRGNPQKIFSVNDLANPALRVALCAPGVPCGSLARELLNRMGVSLQPITEEQNVSAVVAKVRSGDVDAGIVYATDVQAHRADLEEVPLPGVEVSNDYVIAALASSAENEWAQRFVEHVLSDAGQNVLMSDGFKQP